MYGCDVNVFDRRGWMLIYDVISYGKIDVVFKFFENGVDFRKNFFVFLLDIKNFDVIGGLFFMFFVKFYMLEIVIFLLFMWNCFFFVFICYQLQLVVKLIDGYFDGDVGC